MGGATARVRGGGGGAGGARAGAVGGTGCAVVHSRVARAPLTAGRAGERDGAARPRAQQASARWAAAAHGRGRRWR